MTTPGIEPRFVNEGAIVEAKGFTFKDLEEAAKHGWGCSEENPSYPKRELAEQAGVCTGTGDLSETQTDFAIGGRGIGLNLMRTYNSQAAKDGYKGVFGYGWTTPHDQHLTFRTEAESPAESEFEELLPKETHYVTVFQENGSTIEFIEGEGGTWIGPPGTPDVLTGNTAAGFTLTFESQEADKFSGSTGNLESITDRAGNKTTFTYNVSGQLEKVTDPAGRSLTFTYNAEGLVSQVEDPMKHLVKYGYEGGNLVSVTQPGEEAFRWKFKYDGSHQMTELVDGRNNGTKYEYLAGRVKLKTDPLGRKTKFEYSPTKTKITNEATGAVTVEYLTSTGQAARVTHGYGTPEATTESSRYDKEGDQTSHTDGNGHTTKYTYDSHGNRTSKTEPEGQKTEWTYNEKHDVLTETKPNKEKTTYEPSNYDPTKVSRPAPEGKTQETTYEYNSAGQVTKMVDPLKRETTYGYDGYGDKNEEVDPAKDKRTWEYSEDSYELKTISPRGYATKKETSFTTTTERDAQGRALKVTDPLGHETKYRYDGDGNLVEKVDPEGHIWLYGYDADNERLSVFEPGETGKETGYDGAGQVSFQTDGNRHTTKYVRNMLEEVTEVVDPLGRKTTKTYDGAGNVSSVTDPLKQTTTYEYDAENRAKKVTYSDGKTHSVEYEYDEDGNRTRLIDGTGTTTYEHDQLDRLVETKDGHGNMVKYEYDLANEPITLTYPNGKAVIREYDAAGRLKVVKDWLEHTTTFSYDADGDLEKTVFPSGTGNEDKYAYNEADAMKEVKMLKGAETLASLVYTRNKDGLVEKVTSKGLPGAEKPEFKYDVKSRVTKGAGIAYGYDAGYNPTTLGARTYSYDNADEPQEAKEGAVTKATYTYNEDGRRVKLVPSTGPTTTYGYDQAGNLSSVMRPKEGELPAIEDSYTYNGDGLRVSQTISGTTAFLTWSLSEELPLILDDGRYSYIYGPGQLPVEEIGAGAQVTYLHHDQQGSTRVLTGSTGAKEGSATYDAYGNLLGSEGTASTPLGYDGQYTDADTGLVYLRARYYDPGTAAFMSADPVAEVSGALYSYAQDDPLNRSDPSGLIPWSRKVKAAIAKCQYWKHWYSRRSPYYSNRGIYDACQNLLSAGSEVPGTPSQASEIVHGVAEGAVATTDTGCKQWLVGPGIPVAFAFRGAIAAGTAFCGGWVIGRAIDSVFGIE